MTHHILSWYKGRFEIYELGPYDKLDDYGGMKCRTKFESEEEAQDVIDWVLRVLGAEALERLGA